MAKSLVTLDEFKTYKNIINSEQDDLIDAIIKRASALIKTHCGQTFVDFSVIDKTEYFDATAESEYFVTECPILSITSLAYSLDGGSTYETPLVEFTDYFLDEDIGKIITANATTFDNGTSTIPSPKAGRVVYKGGYLKVPPELSQATLDLVEYYREAEYTPRKDFTGFKVENLGFRAGSSASFPGHIKRVLELYRQL